MLRIRGDSRVSQRQMGEQRRELYRRAEPSEELDGNEIVELEEITELEKEEEEMVELEHEERIFLGRLGVLEDDEETMSPQDNTGRTVETRILRAPSKQDIEEGGRIDAALSAQLLDAIAADSPKASGLPYLPDEIRLVIMSMLVKSHYRCMHISSWNDFDSIIWRILERSGNEATTNTLRPILKEAIFDEARIQVNVKFGPRSAARPYRTPTVQHLPELKNIGKHIRHLAIPCRLEVTDDHQPIYATSLLLSTQSFDDLGSMFPKLRSLTLILDVHTTHPKEWPREDIRDLGWACKIFPNGFQGASSIVNTRTIVVDLLDAFKACGLCTRKWFEMEAHGKLETKRLTLRSVRVEIEKDSDSEKALSSVTGTLAKVPKEAL